MDLPSRLSYLFGTEEYVSLRRQLVLMREMLFHHLYREREGLFICSGSFGEGVAYPRSDDDLMMCNTAHKVVKSLREVTQWSDVLLVPSLFSPGYCLLHDITGYYDKNCKFMINGMSFLSSSLWKQTELNTEDSIHGPCLSKTFGPLEFDFARCFVCSFWPNIANDWVIRNRAHGWPSHEMIQNIVRGGCHVVPVGDPDSPFNHHEWRISFSVAERTLMRSFNHVQFLTYNLLRLTLKKILNKIVPGVLCSYFMKTTLFYTLENTSTRRWQVNNMETCFKDCLSLLYNYVDGIYCPNYFIPEYNMIKHKVNNTNRQDLLQHLRLLHTTGIVRILSLCGEYKCLNESLSFSEIEWKMDLQFMFSIHLHLVFNNIRGILDISPHESNESSLFSFCKLVRLLEQNIPGGQSKFLNIILHGGYIYCCQQMMDLLWSVPRINKQNYRHHKTITSLLRLGYNGDVTTGKLTMATYMCMVGKTKSALSVIRQLLSEYPAYVMDGETNDFHKTTYIDTMCSRGYTIDYKARHAFAHIYYLNSKYLNAAPLPLRIWISIAGNILLHPLSYALVLKSLCYVQLQNHISLEKSIRCLTNHLDDLDEKHNIAYTRLCMGIIKYEQGDNQSAWTWLGSAYIKKDTIDPPLNEKFSRSVLTYMCCLLNKQFRLENRIS